MCSKRFSRVPLVTAAVQFVTHCRHAAQALDLDVIVNRGGKWAFPKEKDPGLRWAFTYGVAALATTKTLGRVFEIANDLHGQGHSEYGMLVGQQAMAKGSFGGTSRPNSSGPSGWARTG